MKPGQSTALHIFRKLTIYAGKKDEYQILGILFAAKLIKYNNGRKDPGI